MRVILTWVVTRLSLTLSTDVLVATTWYVWGRTSPRDPRKVIGRTRAPKPWHRHLPVLGAWGQSGLPMAPFPPGHTPGTWLLTEWRLPVLTGRGGGRAPGGGPVRDSQPRRGCGHSSHRLSHLKRSEDGCF